VSVRKINAGGEGIQKDKNIWNTMQAYNNIEAL
jgi:hypothetical protein